MVCQIESTPDTQPLPLYVEKVFLNLNSYLKGKEIYILLYKYVLNNDHNVQKRKVSNVARQVEENVARITGPIRRRYSNYWFICSLLEVLEPSVLKN